MSSKLSYYITVSLILNAISMSAFDLIQGEADVDEEEVDESFDEETGEAKPRNNDLNGGGFQFEDSSEEEDDDDDEEAAREVCSLPQKI